jgi:hypothetical protein
MNFEEKLKRMLDTGYWILDAGYWMVTGLFFTGPGIQ